MTAAPLLALLLAAPGAPPGLGLAVGTWPLEWPGRAPPPAIRAWVEPAIERRLPAEERGCFLYAFEDLDGDGRDELLVFVETFGWCGTGGCPLYVMRWRGPRLRVVSRSTMVRNVFLAPWSCRAGRPLYVEKWGEVVTRVTPRRGRYPAVIDWDPARGLTTFPEGIRQASWIEAASCAAEEGVPEGLRPARP